MTILLTGMGFNFIEFRRVFPSFSPSFSVHSRQWFFFHEFQFIFDSRNLCDDFPLVYLLSHALRSRSYRRVTVVYIFASYFVFPVSDSIDVCLRHEAEDSLLVERGT